MFEVRGQDGGIGSFYLVETLRLYDCTVQQVTVKKMIGFYNILVICNHIRNHLIFLNILVQKNSEKVYSKPVLIDLSTNLLSSSTICTTEELTG